MGYRIDIQDDIMKSETRIGANKAKVTIFNSGKILLYRPCIKVTIKMQPLMRKVRRQ